MVAYAKIALVAAAPIANLLLIKEKIAEFELIVAVDGGANHCRQMSLQPDLILGDFDSIDAEAVKAFSHIAQERFPTDKDKTDLELAIEHVMHSEIEKIVVFGAVGGRTDHTLGNLILLSRYPGKVVFETEHEQMFVIDKRVELATKIGQTISLIPLNGPVQGIATEGLKWALKDGKLDKHFIGISNEATSTKVIISVKQGDLLCCLNN